MKIKVPTVIDMCQNGNAHIIQDGEVMYLLSYSDIIAVYAPDEVCGKKMWRTKDFITTTSRRHFEEFCFYVGDYVHYDYLSLDRMEVAK